MNTTTPSINRSLSESLAERLTLLTTDDEDTNLINKLAATTGEPLYTWNRILKAAEQAGNLHLRDIARNQIKSLLQEGTTNNTDPIFCVIYTALSRNDHELATTGCATLLPLLNQTEHAQHAPWMITQLLEHEQIRKGNNPELQKTLSDLVAHLTPSPPFLLRIWYRPLFDSATRNPPILELSLRHLLHYLERPRVHPLLDPKDLSECLHRAAIAIASAKTHTIDEYRQGLRSIAHDTLPKNTIHHSLATTELIAAGGTDSQESEEVESAVHRFLETLQTFDEPDQMSHLIRLHQVLHTAQRNELSLLVGEKLLLLLTTDFNAAETNDHEVELVKKVFDLLKEFDYADCPFVEDISRTAWESAGIVAYHAAIAGWIRMTEASPKLIPPSCDLVLQSLEPPAPLMGMSEVIEALGCRGNIHRFENPSALAQRILAGLSQQVIEAPPDSLARSIVDLCNTVGLHDIAHTWCMRIKDTDRRDEAIMETGLSVAKDQPGKGWDYVQDIHMAYHKYHYASNFAHTPFWNLPLQEALEFAEYMAQDRAIAMDATSTLIERTDSSEQLRAIARRLLGTQE